MMVGMILITLIIAFSAPLGGIFGAIVVGVAKVALSAALAIFWLYLWSRVARAYFSWAIEKEKKSSFLKLLLRFRSGRQSPKQTS